MLDPVLYAFVDLDESKERIRPDDQVLAQAAEVRAQQGGPEQKLGDKVAIAHGVEAVLGDCGKAQIAGQRLDADLKAVSGQRRRAKGQHGRPLLDAFQPLQVALQHPESRTSASG